MKLILRLETKVISKPHSIGENNVKECKSHVNVHFLRKGTLNFDVMKKRTKRAFGIFAFFMSIGCGYAFWGHDAAIKQQQHLTQRIHLALRRTAHLLLKQTGDSTSNIAPIQQTGETTYLVKLEHDFNYDSLPTFLQNSLDLQEITNKYDVVIRDYHQDELILGYSSLDFFSNKDVPCGGRSQPKGSSNFSVTFKDPSVSVPNFKSLAMFLGGLLVMAVAAMSYFYDEYFKKKEHIAPFISSNQNQKTDEAHLIYIGQTVFNTQNQTLLTHNNEQKLTFQEAQLLQLFCQYKNELLERDFILKQVWGDEGMLITRSVDVFVSRLRQLLKPDTSLKITNVYNRGYRFETTDN